MLMSIGANGIQQEVKSVIFEDNVNRPSSAESESTPLPPVTLLGPGPVPPRQSSALPPQAIPQQPGSVPPPEAPFPTAVRVHQPLQTQALSPQILPSGVLPFIAQDGLAPKRTFTPPGALPLAQPASRREVEVTQPDAVETETPRAIATNTRSSSEGEAVVVSTPSNSLHEGLFKEDASAEQRGDPATAKLGTGLLKEQPLAGRLDELEEDVRSGVPGPNLSGAQEPPADTIGNKASPSAAPQTSLQRQQGQIGSPILPSVQLESPSSDTSALDFSGNRPKSSHGLRNPQSAVLPEEPPLKAQELNPQILAVDSTPPAVETLRTISISRPPPLAQEAPAQPAQPFLSRQPSRTMAYSGGAALTFTCASCNYAQMLPALPPGVHNMRCGTCGSINEVQIAAPPAAVPTPMPAVPPPQMYAGQQGGVYGQQPVSSPGSQGGSYAAPPSPPAQNMRCGACGTLMILPPLEPGVHQLRCGGCQAVNSVHIQPQAVQPTPQLSSYPSGHYNGPSRPGTGSSLKEKLKKNFKKHMEFQKSGGNAAALFQRPGFGSPQQWAPPQQAQPGYQPLPQQGYPQTTPQGYQLPGPQEYQQTAPQGYQQPSPQGYLETTPQGYQQTAPQQPAEQVYQQPSPQVYQPTSPQGYRQSSPQGYQQTPQPGYLQPARVVSPRSPQPTAQPGYEQTSQQGYSIQAKPAYQTPVEPTGQQTPQPAYASAVDSVYQPLAQPASQPDYQQTPQPVQQQAVFQPTVRPVHSPQSQPVYRPPAAQLVHVQSPPQGASPVLAPAAQTANLAQPAVPQAQVAATPVTPPAEPGLDAYLEAQLKITQSPPSSAGSARRPGSLPHCASNLSNQSADGQAANTLGQRASSETPGSGETLRGAAQEQTDLDRQAAYPILAQSPSGSDKQVSPPARSPPSRPVQSPPPEKVQFQAWEYVPPEGGQPPVEPLPNVAQPVPAARVSTPPAFPPASGAPPVSVFHFERLTQPQPMSYPPQVSQASPVFSPQADILQEANNISPREASPHPPLSPPPLAHTFTPQPSPTTPPQRGIYSQSSDQSSLASFSSAGTGPVNTAPQQWQPDPLLAPAAIWVNGHRLTEELTSAAEVLAGPIERGGFYWYDPVAGFWGEYGKPCQGILPPGIPEFDFPLPPDAAGGTTGIYVNGRQLAARDLAMLRQRKFPQKERKRYTLDIGGTLKDEETGKVVIELGKLAQSVEESGVGKGMKKAQFAPPPPPVQAKPKGKGWGDLRTLLQK